MTLDPYGWDFEGRPCGQCGEPADLGVHVPHPTQGLRRGLWVSLCDGCDERFTVELELDGDVVTGARYVLRPNRYAAMLWTWFVSPEYTGWARRVHRTEGLEEAVTWMCEAVRHEHEESGPHAPVRAEVRDLDAENRPVEGTDAQAAYYDRGKWTVREDVMTLDLDVFPWNGGGA